MKNIHPKINGADNKYFSASEIENDRHLKQFAMNLNAKENEQVLLILSGVNRSNNIYRGYAEDSIVLTGELIKTLSALAPILYKNHKENDHYILIDKDVLVQHDQILYDCCHNFRFSSLVGIKPTSSKDAIIAEIKRFSLKDIFNTKRWNKIATWQFFFDGEHGKGAVSIL